jgi:putative ABC transport system permease protein
VTRLALRGLAARKLRTSLTIVAVLLGVTMIAGTFVLTDTIQRAFDDIFSAQTKGADVIVSGRTQVESDFSEPRPLDDSLLREIKSQPEVAQVAGQINDVAAVVGKDGKIVSTGGAPTIAATYMPKPFAPIGFSKGRAPSGENEIALDAATADKEGFKLGDEVTVATNGPKRPFKLVGLATIGNAAGLGGATFVVFDLATAQTLFDKRGKVDFAFVAGRPGVSQADLKRRIATLLPPNAQVRTAAQEADKLGDDIREGLSFLTTGLLAFAFIAVLVGAFLIFNTVSITVAQRSSSRCCGRSARPAARCSARSCSRRSRSASSARSSASSPGSASRRPSTPSSRRSASTCRPRASCSSPARSSSACSSARS